MTHLGQILVPRDMTCPLRIFDRPLFEFIELRSRSLGLNPSESLKNVEAISKCETERVSFSFLGKSF